MNDLAGAKTYEIRYFSVDGGNRCRGRYSDFRQATRAAGQFLDENRHHTEDSL